MDYKETGDMNSIIEHIPGKDMRHILRLISILDAFLWMKFSNSKVFISKTFMTNKISMKWILNHMNT